MKTLTQILQEHNFDLTGEDTKESIKDTEYLLTSESHTYQKRKEYAIKNLNRLFCGDYKEISPVIVQVIDEFLKEKDKE